MKALKVDLCTEGRYDVLERVKPYRGGKYNCLEVCLRTQYYLGYSQEVSKSWL